MVVGSLEYG